MGEGFGKPYPRRTERCCTRWHKLCFNMSSSASIRVRDAIVYRYCQRSRFAVCDVRQKRDRVGSLSPPAPACLVANRFYLHQFFLQIGAAFAVPLPNVLRDVSVEMYFLFCSAGVVDFFSCYRKTSSRILKTSKTEKIRHKISKQKTRQDNRNSTLARTQGGKRPVENAGTKTT